MDTYAIETYALRKDFIETAKWLSLPFLPSSGRRSVCAVNGVDLRVRRQEIVTLVGPNGAGKTTLIKLLYCLLYPTSGTARVAGFDISREEYRIKSVAGLVMADERNFYWRLSGRQNLEFFARLYGLSSREIRGRIRELASLMGIEAELDRRFFSYSAGTRQKLALVRGLLHRPAVLLMDEPFKNLDQGMIKTIQAYIRKDLVAGCGTTVLCATHDLPEMEGFATMFVAMEEGSIKTAYQVH